VDHPLFVHVLEKEGAVTALFLSTSGCAAVVSGLPKSASLLFSVTWLPVLAVKAIHTLYSFWLILNGPFICRSFVVVGAPSVLALNNNVAGQHFWLLQPVFSHNKSW